ncbi:hypothetical protein Q670_00195 [Alcanivorax sp. P2S70]|uniref:DUF479 domain-containing protein n=1 Tax=Alcanivorax profundi TaxID=2338368 RepID=A0A418XU56_9GAMM|nr:MULTISPECIES: ACP phosphodiesterase [Alcanivorax]ERP93336.1 hypothetical protein Q670_00195 [Alcanivorax sp. P2S70]RJG16157.1 DUF479 domain-containing protein [Alcanivorax profundi]|tara:strand:+ start:1794 stop:2399 length:606 start_codon:yes stop_codon:yes gene_type:complete
MNYLAHLSLAKPSVPSKVGNVLGDFLRGVDRSALSGPVARGLANHLLVDRFTDDHPWVVAQRRGFSSQRRRFSGVALDVLFDHFLWQHWSDFHAEPREEAIAQHYRDLEAGLPMMPATMRPRMEGLLEHDLLNRYARLSQVGEALDAIAARIRFANPFAGMVEEIEPRYETLEAGFLVFYPQLREAVEQAALELPVSPERL